ncbi:phage antirepressor [Dialister invisus]|uniref:phage antirepressor n=1 Tax=Dialister invisus TaxID=218538 RepID=UPI0023F50DD7|nr:phage antirepressor [Dialister invisus]
MNDLKVFNNLEFGAIRVFERENTPWFVGKDVADILGYQNGSRDINRHVDEEDRHKVMFFDGNQDKETIIINESGLYSLILSSKMPNAKKFKHWVTSEVLPTIRKHGAYMTEETIEKAITSPDFLIKLATNLKEEKEKRLAAERQIEADRPKVTFANAVNVSKDGMLIGMLAKLLHQNGVDIGQKRLFQWMRDNGYLMKSGADRNMPTQKARELGLFKVKERAIDNPDGSVRLTRTTLVTGKGQEYFINKFLSAR